jgi:acyl-CoA synthetase (AMP-forming)/AMP-acid ligase II
VQTLVQLLEETEERDAQRLAFVYLERGSSPAAELTIGELMRRARRVAACLRARVEPGDRVLLVFPHRLEFIEAFLGCLFAGVVAVPAVPPANRRARESWTAVARATRPSVVLTQERFRGLVDDLLKEVGPGRVECLEDLYAGEAPPWRAPDLRPETIAYLQFTSGSTGTPKGVVVTHGNLLHNCALLEAAVSLPAGARMVSWLPFFHDWGLVGCVVFPLSVGMPCYLLDPADFLYAPSRWLRAIAQFGAAISCAPSFAYEACATSVREEEKPGLDLSRWEVAMVGAEPVRRETLRRFAVSFAGCGFRPEAFYPTYGLAEATLIVSGGNRTAPPVYLAVDRRALEGRRVVPVSEEDPSARVLVGCGRPVGDQRVRIVDGETRRAGAPEEVGEVWVSGSSVTGGYWGQVEETHRTFGASLAGEDGGPWLRTGDLGFLWDGELFLCGRSKDVIIKAGNNYFAEDVEHSAGGSHPSLRAGCGAAFAVDAAGAERLVVVHELEFGKKPDAKLIGTMQKRIFDDLGVLADAIVILRPGGLPKTTSGKIRRQRTRALFLGDELDVLTKWSCW